MGLLILGFLLLSIIIVVSLNYCYILKRKEDINTDINNNPNPDGSESVYESLPDATVELTDQVAKLEGELTESKDKYLRMYSEFENYKKRVSNETLYSYWFILKIKT